jgi:trigger factor
MIIDRIIQERAKTFKLAGFRPGMVPLNLVKKQIGHTVLMEVLELYVKNIVQKIQKQENNQYYPDVQIKEFNLEKDLILDLSFINIPTIPKLNLKNYTLEILDLNVTDDDIVKAKSIMQRMIYQYLQAPEGYVSKDGDAVIIDFKGTLDGVEFPNNTATGIRVDIGTGQMIEDFERQLIGLKKNDHIQINVKFPENYNSFAEIAGKTAVFDIKVHDILVPEGNNLDEEILKMIDDKTLSIEEFITDKIKNEFYNVTKLRTKKLLFDLLDREYNFDIPQQIIDKDIQLMKEIPQDEAYKLAHRRVKLGLILADIVKQNSLTVSEDDIENYIENEKSKPNAKIEEIDNFLKQPENYNRLYSTLLEDKAVDVLIKTIPNNIITITKEEFNDKYSKEIEELFQ